MTHLKLCHANTSNGQEQKIHQIIASNPSDILGWSPPQAGWSILI